MCGIAGFFCSESAGTADWEGVAQRMGEAISHRGPDGAGTWRSQCGAMTMTHRRLSIIELSRMGHQPMVSSSGRYVISFNGEIYNHAALRKKIEKEAVAGAPVWRGRSDTETLLAAIEVWGLATSLASAIGMFAIALWDRKRSTLYLARDRMGEKPLYYGWQRGCFLFGSELGALKAHPYFSGKVDLRAQALFFKLGYIPSPMSIYDGIYKLPPGNVLKLDTRSSMPTYQVEEYWKFSESRQASNQCRNKEQSPKEALAALEALVLASVERQMMSDVPLGAFLSGGIDSSTIVAIMQSLSENPVDTFTVGFSESGFDESDCARRIAAHLGTNHYELLVSPKEAIEVIPKLSHTYSEPFADASQIPTILLSEFTRRQVTVALSGDGGDELFGGYNRHLGTKRWWPLLS